MVRTWQELNGEDAVPNEELAKKKSICTSRSFNGMISDKDTLRTYIANYATRCAEKLRAQKTVATTVRPGTILELSGTAPCHPNQFYDSHCSGCSRRA